MPRVSLRKKDGQVSVLIAAFIALSMVLLAFGIDIAHVLVQKRQAQNAADAAALYVGQFLPLNATDPPCDSACQAQISAGAAAYSGYNGGPSAPFPACSPPSQPQVITTNCYLTPYNGRGCPPAGCSNLVQIRIHEPVQLWFAGVVPGLAGAINGVNAKAVGQGGAVTGTTTIQGTTVNGTTIAGTTINGTTINGTTINGVTNAGTTTPGTTVAGTTIAGSTVPATTIVGTTNPGHVSTIFSTTVNTNVVSGGPSGAVGFVMSDSCNALQYTGAGKGTIGALMTNGGAQLSGATKDVQSLGVGHLGAPGCYSQGSNVTVDKLYGPFSHQDWPIPPPTPPTDPTPDCTHNLGGASLTFTKTGNPAGVYCLSAGTLTIPGSGVNYSGYTFIAPTIVVSATNSTFSPASGESTVFYNSGGNSLSINDTSATTHTTSNTISGAMCLGNASLSFSQTKHPKGVYCLTGPAATTFNLSSNSADFSGYTFYAPSISVNSNGQLFSPAAGQTAVVDAYLGSLILNGNSNTMNGNIFAPSPTAGDATINGGALGAGSGYIEVQTLSISGNFASFTGTGPGGGGTLTTSTVTTQTPTTIAGTTVAGTTVVTTSPATTVAGTTNNGSTLPGTTTPGTTINGVTNPSTTNPGFTQPGSTTPGSTQTQTTGTTVALNE